jgi:hypothetical protein
LKSNEGGRFSLEAETSNGVVSLDIPTIPFESTMKLEGKTSNAPINVYLDKRGSYEGSYRANTSIYMGMPTLKRADSSEYQSLPN